ncbi:MAG: cobaltochelatase subunit CobN, partial [Methanosarcinaceae archaeon]|nr:cobaltochelatase subunit CobN [Methanosarcinaceae archaeon]
TPELITEAMWDEVYKTYFQDQYDTGINEHLKNTNPYAYQSMALNLIESARRGDWQPSEEVLKELAREYAESVVEEGATCCHHTCGNPTLARYIEGLVSVPGYREVIEDVNQQPLVVGISKSHGSSGNRGSSTPQIVAADNSNRTESSSSSSSEADAGYGLDISIEGESAVSEKQASTAESDYVEGYEMQKENTDQTEEGGGMSFSGADIAGTLFVISALGAIFLGLRKRKF